MAGDGVSRQTGSTVRGPGPVPLLLMVNGQSYELQVEPRQTLLDVLRDEIHLTGTKRGCDLGQCGACTVIVDGKAVYSCLALAVECEGKSILTIEGLSDGVQLHPIQQAFVEHDAFQCGFCTPGQVLAAKALLDGNPSPSDLEISQGMVGNLCRCGAYRGIHEAVQSVAKRRPRQSAPKLRRAGSK